MGAAMDMASFLHIYGGWGLSAILMAVTGVLYRQVSNLNAARISDHKEINEETLQMVEKRIEADLKHATSFKGLKVVVEKLIEKL